MGSPVKKNNWMYIGIVLTWTICLIHFNPKLFEALEPTDLFITKVVYVAFIFFLDVFWLYGIYHCFFIIYRFTTKKQNPPERGTDSPSVAILYTTKNDFQEKAALSCLSQIYPDFRVYILDDSTDEGYKRLIDEFHNAHPNKTTIIRRMAKVGFKAGNLNNALKHYAVADKYFAVIDADEVIPSNFLNELIPYFSINERIAFVQANHGQNPQQPSKFAADLAQGINFHWDVYQPPRNDYGFVVFYGHGAVIRCDVWEEVGGFPEIVSEDLAFSTRIRQLGYSGYFVKEVLCYEDFPETYHQFRKRHEKWVKGACEYFHREFPSFLLSKNVTLSEKLDVLFSCFSLFIPAAFLIYIVLSNAVLPMLVAEEHTISISLFGRHFELMSGYFMEPFFRKLWTFDFYIITLVGMFAPILCYL
jgi:cellulose synthase/poly-beta-1,6-N-acetylglucosamine synthase-like glycosyltransferase